MKRITLWLTAIILCLSVLQRVPCAAETAEGTGSDESLLPFYDLRPDTPLEELEKETGETAIGGFVDFSSSWMGMPCKVTVYYENGRIISVDVLGTKSGKVSEDERVLEEIREDAFRFYGEKIKQVGVTSVAAIDGEPFGGYLTDLESFVFELFLSRDEVREPFRTELFQSHDNHFYKIITDDMEDKIFIQTDFAAAKESSGQYYELNYATDQTDKNDRYFTLIYPSILVLNAGKENETPVFRIMIDYVGNHLLNVDSCIIKIGDEKFEFSELGDHKTEILDNGAAKEYITIVLDRDSQVLLDTWRSVLGTVKIRLKGEWGDSDLAVAGSARMDIKDIYQLYLEAAGGEFSYKGGTPMETTVVREVKKTGKEAIYQEALSLENSGRYYEAVDRYKTIAGYRDADERIRACRQGSIRNSMNIGLFSAALKELEPYRDEEWAEPLYRICSFRNAHYIEMTPSGTLWVQYEKDGPFLLMAGDGTVLLDHMEGRTRDYDDYGKQIVKPGYDACSKFNCGHAVLTRGGKQFLVDREGNETELSGKLNYKYPLTETLIRFEDNKGNAGVADANGKIVIKAAWKYINETGVDLLEVTNNKNQQGIIDLKGKTVVAPGKYDICTVLNEDLFYVAKHDKKTDKYNGGFINRKGKELRKTGEYEGTWAMQCGDLIIAKKDGSYGVTDQNFKTVLPFGYKERTRNAEGSRFALWKNKKWSIYRSDGTPEVKDVKGENKLLLPPAGQQWFVVLVRGAEDAYYIMDMQGNVIY